MENIKLNNNTNNYSIKKQTIENKDSQKNQETTDIEKKKKIKKAIIIASAATAAIGVAAIAIKKGKDIKQAQNFFKESVKEATGNNKIFSDTIKKQNNVVDKFIKDNPEGYENIKKFIKENVDLHKAEEIIPEGKVFHGTSVDSAKNILKNGMSPFVERRSGSGAGLGNAIYTTSNLDAAKFYSKGGVILPFKVQGNIATLKKEAYKQDPNSFIIDLQLKIMEALEPNAPRSILGPNFSDKSMNFAMSNGKQIINRAMNDTEIIGLKTDTGITKGLLTSLFGEVPEFLDKAGQIAIYDGSKISLDTKLLEELNKITKQNYRKFIR